MDWLKKTIVGKSLPQLKHCLTYKVLKIQFYMDKSYINTYFIIAPCPPFLSLIYTSITELTYV